jgi:hypothetical protein
MKIKLPVTWSSHMMNIKIKCYEYKVDGYWEIWVSGYNYTVATTWANSYGCTVIGNPINSTVRMAHDGTNCCILIGAVGTAWSYPVVDVEIMGGYGSSASFIGSEWDLSFITVETGITVSATPTSKLSSPKVYNAVYNDIADFLEVEDSAVVEFGYAYAYDGKDHRKTSTYGDPCALGIASDTFGFGVGQKPEGTPQLPLAIGGFVLAYTRESYPPGTPLTSDKDGYLAAADTDLRVSHPERILATFYKEETGETWHDIMVAGRHWVKVR